MKETQKKAYWWDEDIETDIKEKRKINERFVTTKKQENEILLKVA